MARKEIEIKFRRDFIIKSAESLFIEKGFDKVRMEDIAKKSEFSRQTLYSYFKNKYELLIIVFLKKSLIRWEYLGKRVKKGKCGYEKLEIFGDAYFRFFNKRTEELKLSLFWDHNGIDYNKINKKIKEEFVKPLVIERKKFFSMFEFGVKDKTLNPDLDYKIIGGFFVQSLRTILNEVLILKYNTKEDYYKFLNYLLIGFKNNGG